MTLKPTSKVVLSTDNYRATAESRDFRDAIDTALEKGGSGTGPTPVEYFLAAIGGCVAITLRTYAEKMEWDIGEITVVAREDTKLTSNGIVKTILEEISVEKKVTSEQLTLLKERAKSCPVAQMIKHQTEFRSIMKN